MLNTIFLPFLSLLPTSKQSSDFSPVCGLRKHTHAVHAHSQDKPCMSTNTSSWLVVPKQRQHHLLYPAVSRG